MASGNSPKKTTTSTDNRDEFECPICYEFAFEPFSIKPCNHFLCKRCLMKIKKTDFSTNCPVCRTKVEISIPYLGMERKMAELLRECPGCGDLIKLCLMRQHVLNCSVLEDLQKKYLKGCDNESLPVKRKTNQKGKTIPSNLNLRMGNDSAQSSQPTNQSPEGKDNIIHDNPDEEHELLGACGGIGAQPQFPQIRQRLPSSREKRNDSFPKQPIGPGISQVFGNASYSSSPQGNQHTYICPYCEEPDLLQHDLIMHCQSLHSLDTRKMVCPICASMPWGNRDQASANLFGHFNLRHSYNQQVYIVNNADDEAAMLAKAVDESLRYF